MLRKTVLILIATAAMLALVTYSVKGDTGPIGWLDALQASLFGSYSRKLSFVVLLLPTALLGAGMFLLLWPDATVVLASPAQTTPATYRTAAVIALVAGVPLSWSASYGFAWWQARAHAGDRSAEYALLDLATTVPGMPRPSSHFAVRGLTLTDRVVKKTEGTRETEMLLPIVAPTWAEGDPVHYVVRISGPGGTAPRAFEPEADGSLRVKVDGKVASAARPVFARMKAPLADDALVLVPVPSRVAAAAGATMPDRGNAVFFGALGSATALLFAAFCMLAAFREKRKDERATAAAG